jgi:hypothetical protein
MRAALCFLPSARFSVVVGPGLGVGQGGERGQEEGARPLNSSMRTDTQWAATPSSPAWARVTPTTALAAARKYVRTGSRPSGLSFDPDA